MNKPTPHRLLHDALEPEVYAKVMRNFDKGFDMENFLCARAASEALWNAFDWNETKDPRKFWKTEFDKLLQQEQLNNE